MAVKTGDLVVGEGSIFWKYEASEAEAANARPPLVFLHAGVTDHTLWDDQVTYFRRKGWNCLRYDRFGYGKSQPSQEWLQSSPRKPVDHTRHLLQVINTALPTDSKVVAIGLSMGGGLALQFAISHPERTLGIAVLAGGIPGWDYPNTPEEDELFEQYDAHVKANELQKAGQLQVRIWGDGPLQPVGRLSRSVAERVLSWCTDIAQKEYAGIGGIELESAPGEPAVLQSLGTVSVPTAIAYGTYDESNTTAAMKHISKYIKGAEVKEFEAAHMINMELPDETNEWLDTWLGKHFLN